MEDLQHDSLSLDEIVLRLKRQNFRSAIIVSALLMVATLILLFFYGYGYSIHGSQQAALSLALVALLAVLLIPILASAQMIMLRKYLLNFAGTEKVDKYLFYLSIAPGATIILFIMITVFISINGYENGNSMFLLLIPLLAFPVLQFMVGWQIVKINSSGNDYVGGLSIVGPLMCTASVLFPLMYLIPFAVAYVFFKAEKYSDRYGFKED